MSERIKLDPDRCAAEGHCFGEGPGETCCLCGTRIPELDTGLSEIAAKLTELDILFDEYGMARVPNLSEGDFIVWSTPGGQIRIMLPGKVLLNQSPAELRKSALLELALVRKRKVKNARP